MNATSLTSQLDDLDNSIVVVGPDDRPSLCDSLYSSWLNLVERWFAELTTKWIKRSAHRSVRDLVASIRTWITDWNDDPKLFVWHKSADEILDSLAAYCQRINDSGH